jgi:hypothetical protein
MAFAGAAGAYYLHGDLLLDEAARSQIMNHRAVQIGQPVEVETFQRFLMKLLAIPLGCQKTTAKWLVMAAEVCAPQSHFQFLLLTPRHFVMDQQAEKVGEGQLAVYGFAVAGFERVEDAGQAQLFEQGC